MINMQVIQSAAVEQHPWHHLSIDDVLEHTVYEQVIDNWPAVKLMEWPADTGFPNRNWLFIYPQTGDGFLYKLGKVLGESIELKSAVFGKLGVDEAKSTHCEVRLITDTKGYKCRPHKDTASKVVSMLLYCPVDSERSHWGTRLGDMVPVYKGKPTVLLGKAEPFVPNHAFIFAQHPKHIHWVDKIDGERRQILICWMTE